MDDNTEPENTIELYDDSQIREQIDSLQKEILELQKQNEELKIQNEEKFTTIYEVFEKNNEQFTSILSAYDTQLEQNQTLNQSLNDYIELQSNPAAVLVEVSQEQVDQIAKRIKSKHDEGLETFMFSVVLIAGLFLGFVGVRGALAHWKT